MQVEIWSDIACPWCYIGKRHFEDALTQFEHADEVTVTWRSFELDPSAPAEVVGDRSEKLAAKYGFSVEQARQLESDMTERAAGVGLDYHLDSARMANTFDAHRVIHFAAEQGLGSEMKERLLAAYFTEGRLISDHAVLAELAAEVGLNPDEVRAGLAGDRAADAVRADERTATQFGISGVPMFVLERTHGLSGAQPVTVMLEALRRSWAETQDAAAVPAPSSAPGAGSGPGAGGDSCGPAGC